MRLSMASAPGAGPAGIGGPGVGRAVERGFLACGRAGGQREGLLRNWQEVGGQRRDMYMYSLCSTICHPSP